MRCRKNRYASRDAAIDSLCALITAGHRVSCLYKCPRCRGWHLASKRASSLGQVGQVLVRLPLPGHEDLA